MISEELILSKLKALDGLSDAEKKLALQILKEVSDSGESSILDNLRYGDFEEIPVDIDTFLDDQRFLGNDIWVTDEFSGQKRCTLFPYWRETLHKIFPDNLTTAYNTLILTGSIGLGKAQPLDSLVLTEDGFKKMGYLTLQDKVYGNDGKLHNIIGIFPQGKKKVCKVTFNDHTSTECCDEHLWTVYNVDKDKEETLELKEIISRGLYRKLKVKSHNYKIPVTAPIEFSNKEVYIDPYTLGVLIGDGALHNYGAKFASDDEEIPEYVRKTLHEGYEVRKLNDKFMYNICKLENDSKYYPELGVTKQTPNKYKAEINRLGLNTTALYKHIPEEYLYNSINNRIALLQGLMDTDGFVSKDGAIIEFTTISKQLCDDFVTLVQSLGGVCHIRTKIPSYKNKQTGERVYCNRSYNIGIKLPKNICPFRLTRKIARLSEKALSPTRYIDKIEYIEDKECQCIYIDSEEHLYLTNDFIVTHNTECASIAMLYLLYRMLCLKDPYTYYGLMPNDKITFSLLNITLETAKGVGWQKLQQHIQNSPWFMEHGALNASRTNPTWQPDKNIELVFGSSNNQVVGRALFSNFSDEVNFSGGNLKNIENQKNRLLKLISQIDARMVSRFGKGTFLPTLNIIASSKDTEQSFLDSYIEKKKKNNSKSVLIIDEPQWVVRNDKGTPDDPGAFYVAVGGKLLAHELLPVGASDELVQSYKSKGYMMLKVPPIYREHFETNLDQALMDDAGISSASTTKFLAGDRLVQAKTEEYRNPFVKDVIEVGNNPEDHLQYANFFDMSALSEADIGKPLFIHLDMSVSGDKTGIAGTVIEGKQPSVPGQDESLSLRYKLLFSVSIKAPKGFQISFEKTQNFIKWLRDKGFSIKMISADTYQSAAVLQELQTAGFKTQILSVDRTNTDRICEPYQYLKSAIYERRVKIYDKCDLLTEELINLEKESNGKINHPENGKRGCFTGDTKISLVDGRKVALVDLVKEFNEGKINYVYSFNETTKKIEPKPIIKAWCTQKDASLVEVTLDSGEVIRCTPNHRFMLRDSTYREAKDLVENDSLMPLYTKYPSDCDLSDYRLYYEPMEDKWHYEHRQFATEVLDEKYLVHHKNCKPSDNTPTNLVWCSQAKHMELHKELSTGACSPEAIAKKSESLKEWYRDPENADIIEAKRQKLSKQRYEQLGWTEDDIQQHKLKIEQQHENGARLAAEAKQKAAEKAAYIKDIETTFNICWDSLSITEKNSYSVKYQRMQNPETQDKINAAVKENHKLGKYANADKALAECNLESKKLKELCPTVDYDKFIQMFGFDLRSLPGGPGSKRAPWITKYRKIICKEILNHKVKSVRYIDTKEDVYDLTIQDNHNFALAAGIFVHNSKDQADAFCGSLFMASKFAEEYAYNYGENLTAAIEANNIEISDNVKRQQMMVDFEQELAKIYVGSARDTNSAEQRRRQQEYRQLADIADGIINIF